MRRRTFLQSLPASLAPALGAWARGVHLRQLTASTACLAGLAFNESLRRIRELGFEGVEILTFAGATHSVGPIPGAVVSDLKPGEREQLREMVGGFRFVTTHLPFHGLRPVAAQTEVRKAALDRIRQGIEDSGFWRASIATAHAAGEAGKTARDLRPELIQVFRDLGDHAARHKVRIGIETGWPNTVEDYLDLIRAIDHEHVGATIDTGHIRSYRTDIGVSDDERGTEKGRRRYNDVLMQIVDGLGSKLIHFHFDDVRAADWREHRTLGTGIVDWPRLLRRLNELAYTGAFVLELEETGTVEALKQSREFLRSVPGVSS